METATKLNWRSWPLTAKLAVGIGVTLATLWVVMLYLPR
jgi:hypothetical protein